MKSQKFVLWACSVVLSVIAIAIIVNKWMDLDSTGYKPDLKPRYTEVIVTDRNEVETYFEEWQTDDSLKLVPTGFFIQSIKFESPNEVNFTGHIWQKIPPGFPDTTKLGIDFPEQVNSSSTKFEELYSSDEDGFTLKGWYFDVTVRQIFDYTKYPFDNIKAWLRIWPKDFDYDDAIMLVPDFEAYHIQDTVFGMDEDIVGGEWTVDKTFFSYHENTYNTNFGYAKDDVDAKYREFYINVGLRRSTTDSIVLNLIPLFVVALLLFAQMMTVTGKNDLAQKFGFNTNAVLATCSALFFIVLLAHIQVRQQFLDSPLVYIEYFYLIMYVVILLCALNAYVFSIGKQKRFNLVSYKDNLIPKVAFWPLLFWMMALVTLVFL